MEKVPTVKILLAARRLGGRPVVTLLSDVSKRKEKSRDGGSVLPFWHAISVTV